MCQGFITLHRKMLEWEWYTDNNVKVLFLHCLFKANHKAKKWQGITIERGQFITGRKQLSLETGLTEQQVRTALTKLNGKELTIKTTNKYSVVTVVNYSTYQDIDNKINQQVNQQITNKQPTNNQQVTTTNNDNNNNNDNNDNNKNIIVEILDYLNLKTGSNFKSNSKATQKFINARLKEKYTVEDFKNVIDKKCNDWLNDKQMSQYLRPSTLFNATKFENYYQEVNSGGVNNGRSKQDRFDSRNGKTDSDELQEHIRLIGANTTATDEEYEY